MSRCTNRVCEWIGIVWSHPALTARKSPTASFILSCMRLSKKNRAFRSVLAVVAVSALLLACSQQDSETQSSGLSDALPLQPSLPAMARSDWGSYVDPVTGFSARAPVGWTVSTLGNASTASFKSDSWFDSEGHAVTFQSPASSADDNYSDYIMVELLPFAPAAAFISESTDRMEVTIDGRSTYRERIVMADFPVENTVIDLVAYQLISEELGYSMGLYVVGELREDIRLQDIFSTFLKHFTFPPNDLQVSDISAL